MVTLNPVGLPNPFPSSHMNDRRTVGGLEALTLADKNAHTHTEHAVRAGVPILKLNIFIYSTHWFLWRRQLTLISEIPNVPGFIWSAICSQTRPMNWCGRTNTKMSAPFAASATSGTATWDKWNNGNEPLTPGNNSHTLQDYTIPATSLITSKL